MIDKAAGTDFSQSLSVNSSSNEAFAHNMDKAMASAPVLVASASAASLEEINPGGVYRITGGTFNWLFMTMAAEWGVDVRRMAQGAAIMMNRALDENYYIPVYGAGLQNQIKAPHQLEVLGWPGMSDENASSKARAIEVVANNANISIKEATGLYNNFKIWMTDPSRYGLAVAAAGTSGGWRASGDGVTNVPGPEQTPEGYYNQPSHLEVVEPQAAKPKPPAAPAAPRPAAPIAPAPAVPQPMPFYPSPAPAPAAPPRPMPEIAFELLSVADDRARSLEDAVQASNITGLDGQMSRVNRLFSDHYPRLPEVTRNKADGLLSRLTAELKNSSPNMANVTILFGALASSLRAAW
jgi:hypothetical protein